MTEKTTVLWLVLLAVILQKTVEADSDSHCHQVVAEEPDAVLLPCSCRGNSDQIQSVTIPTDSGHSAKCQQRISWYKDKTHIGDCNPAGTFIDQRFEGYVAIRSDMTLVIPTSNASHHGIYSCTSLSWEDRKISLVVRVPPSNPEVADLSPHFMEGEKAVLSCLVPRVRPVDMAAAYWKTSTGSSDDTKMSITNETLNKDGTTQVIMQAEITFSRQDNQHLLWCITTWGNPKQDYDNTSHVLDVWFPATDNHLSTTPSDHLAEGQLQNFSCSTKSSNPRSEISWFLGDAPFVQNATTSYLPGSDGGVITHSGISVDLNRTFNDQGLQCRVSIREQEFGSLARNHNIRMEFPPTSMAMDRTPEEAQREGFTQKFTCKCGSSNPQTEIRWFVGEKDMTSEARTIQADGDYGGYNVTSQIYLRVSRENNGVNVSCEPLFKHDNMIDFRRESQITTTYPHDVTVDVVSVATQGEDVTVSCIAENGNPETVDDYTYVFYPKDQNDDPYTLSCKTQSCLLTDVQPGNAGTYRCEARNWDSTLSGTGSSSLDVLYAPFVLENGTNLDVFASDEETVRLHATLSAWPPDVTVVCSVADGPILAGTEITSAGADQLHLTVVLNVTQKGHRRIQCLPQNTAGEGHPFVFNIHKLGSPKKPLHVHDGHITSNSVWVYFTASLDGGSTQTFSLLFREMRDSEYTVHSRTVQDPGRGFETGIKLTKLKPATPYHVIVRATNGMNATNDSDRISLVTRRAPHLNGVTASWDETTRVLKLKWTLDPEYHYTRQVIRECTGRSIYSDEPCTLHHVKHGDTKRLFPGRAHEDHYTVHLLLYDLNDEVLRRLLYEANQPSTGSCDCTKWIALFGFHVTLVVLLMAASAFLFHLWRRAKKKKKAPEVIQLPPVPHRRRPPKPPPTDSFDIEENYINRGNQGGRSNRSSGNDYNRQEEYVVSSNPSSGDGTISYDDNRVNNTDQEEGIELYEPHASDI